MKLEREYEIKQKDLRDISSALEKLRVKIDATISSSFVEVVSSLQSTLKDGEACIVCGSTEHDHNEIKQLVAVDNRTGLRI